MNPIPADWLPDADMARVVVHWTAGTHKANDVDRAHYHILIEGDGKLVKGHPSIALNSLPKAKEGYAAHTLNLNSGSIGVSLCSMGGPDVSEEPYRPGQWPLTTSQWDMLPKVLAQLCKRYGIAVTRQTVLSHAEVQPTLGIKQRGKWDITRLPFLDTKGAIPIGDLFRSATIDAMKPPVVNPPPPPPPMVDVPFKLPPDYEPPEPSPQKQGWLAALIALIASIFGRKP